MDKKYTCKCKYCGETFHHENEKCPICLDCFINRIVKGYGEEEIEDSWRIA